MNASVMGFGSFSEKRLKPHRNVLLNDAMIDDVTPPRDDSDADESGAKRRLLRIQRSECGKDSGYTERVYI